MTAGFGRDGQGMTRSEAERHLTALKEQLLVLHKTLIESERIEYERTFGSIESPNQFLKLLMNDPWFAWLRPISMLVVTIDELLEGEDPVNGETVGKVHARTAEILEASEEGQGFARSYFEALQRTPEVILAHAGVKELLRS